MDAEGTVLAEKSFPHSGEGFHQLQEWICDHTQETNDRVALAIELPNGPVVESLMEYGFQVFAINPKQLDRFRDRFSPAGAKDDRRDARVLADAVRTDPKCLRKLDPVESEIVLLREWSRLADELTARRTQLTHRIREQLWRYFPQFLELKLPLCSAALRELWALIPTPERARRVRITSVEKILKKHRIRRIHAEQVLTLLRSTPLSLADGTLKAATTNLRLHFQQLDLINEQLQEAEKTMKSILEELVAEAQSDPSDPVSSPAVHDVEILGSLPGIGTKVLATLLSEAPGLLKARDYRALRSFCGVAPVTRQSGKTRRVIQRKACLGRLSNAVYHWSRVAVQHDPICKAKYKALRSRGHSHGRALRSVGDRLLAVACAMLRDGTCYDPSHATGTNGSVLPVHV